MANDPLFGYEVPVHEAPAVTATLHQPPKTYVGSKVKASAVSGLETPVVKDSVLMVPEPPEALNVTVFTFGDHIS